MKRFASKTCILAALLLLLNLPGLAACAPELSNTPTQSDAPAQEAQPQFTAAPETTAPPARQSGTLDAVLLDGVMLHVAAQSYRFVENDGVCVTIAARNDNGNPATVWLLLNGINGWDVRNLQQSMLVIRLAPGEQTVQEIVFDLNEQSARHLNIAALAELAFTTEGYVDSTDYEYVMMERVVKIPDAPDGYVQDYLRNKEILLDNAFLTVASCGQDENSGAITLYYEVKTAVEGARCKLYPLENGVFDTQRYPALDELDMGRASKRLIVFVPAGAGTGAAPGGFYAVAEGAAMRPARLTLSNHEEADALSRTLDGMRPAAESDLLRIYYDAQSRRFFAKNRTADQVLLLQTDAQFSLDGRTVRANPQTVPCFPESATAFRVGGRGKDADGMERSRVIDEDSRTASVSWRVWALTDGLAAPEEAETIATGAFALAE